MNRLTKHKATSGSSAFKAGLGYTIGNMLIKGISFLAIPIFSRIMTQEDYGLYNTFLSYASILTIILGMALNASIKNAKYDFRDQLNQYCSSLAVLILCNTVLISALSFIFSAAAWCAGGPWRRYGGADGCRKLWKCNAFFL